MAEQHACRVGTIPPNYDRYLGPILFHRDADALPDAYVPNSVGTTFLI